MSRATGYVWAADATLVGYAMYCGTSDMMWTRIYPSQDAAWEGYFESNRAYDAAARDDTDAIDAALSITSRECTCGEVPTSGFIGSDYGRLSHWPATFCLRCEAIVSGTTFDERWSDEDGDLEREGAPWIEGKVVRRALPPG